MKTRIKYTLTFLAVLVLFLGNVANVFPQGIPDPNFGMSGSVTTKIQSSRDDISQSVAIAPDGKILIAGNSFNIIGYSNIGIVRYKSNGKLDKTFNGTGKKLISNAFCNVIAVQPDNKIVIGGSVAVGSTTVFGLWRLNSDGSNDAGFGTNGYQKVPFGGYVICFAMKLQNDGKILIGGNDGNFYAGNSSLVLARLNSNGQLDNTFSGDGKFSLNLTHKSLTCNEILIQPDGKIIAAGQLDTIVDPNFRNEFFATRLNTDGTTDVSFGNNGIVRAKNSISDVSYCAGLLPDGRVVMAGFSQLGSGNSASVLGITANGTIDNTFGTNGWVYPNFYGGTGMMNAIAIQPNGKIILAGDVYNSNATWSIGLARLNGDGSFDNTFANAGLDTFFNAAVGAIICNDATLQSNGKILVTGSKSNNHSAFFTARFLNALQFERESTGVSESPIGAMNIFPVPVNTNNVLLAFTLSSKGDGIINLYDLQGRSVMSPLYLSFQSGLVKQSISLPQNLLNGVYICAVTINGDVKTVEFTVQR